MPFTGRIGTQNSKLGDIVLGIVDAFELAAFGFRVHVLSSHEIRVRFDHPVQDEAELLSAYTLAAVGAVPAPILPALVSATFYDADRLSVVLRTDLPLTFGGLYSLTVNGVSDYNGQGASGVSVNFTANVPDPPRAMGAFLSRRGAVDIVFDRPVGPTSPSASALIHDSAGGPSAAMVLQAWAGEDIPEDTLRFVYPSTTPTATSFSIDYASVVDAANNIGSGTIPLTVQLRSLPPYNSSSLSQMQFSDAYVAEIVPNIDVATVRVFFNCPASPSESLNLARWTVKQAGPHPRPDTFYPVLVPDGVTAVDAFNILNAIKSTFPGHARAASIHNTVDPGAGIVASNAVDLPTAAVLYTSIVSFFKEHTTAAGRHVYNEPVLPAEANIVDFPTLISLTNSLKVLYNQHLAAERDLPFYGGYPAQIGTILDHASLSKSYPTRTRQTYYVDLHVSTAVRSLPIHVLGQIQSEDGGSVTNPANFSGDIMARAVLDAPVILSREAVLDESITTTFDREISLTVESSVIVQAGAIPVPSVPSLTSTLVDATWFYNSLVLAYDFHIGPVPDGAGHVVTESKFFVVPADYVVTTDLPTLLTKANLFKAKYNGHVQNLVVHVDTDDAVRSDDATDLTSLVTLLGELRRLFLAHNSAGTSDSIYGVPSRRPGRHYYPGRVFLVAKLLGSVRAAVELMRDGAEHTMSISGLTTGWDPARSAASSAAFSSVEPFVGFARRPAVASVLPRPGLVFREDREGRSSFTLESDSIEVYFSKMMHKAELNGGTGSTISVSGGSIILKRADWVDERTVSVAVSRMEQVSYSLSASGLVDLAGNPLV